MADPKLEEFRTNNVRLMQENGELSKQVEQLTASLARFDGIDLAVIAAERTELAELKKTASPARIAELETSLAREKTERQAYQKKVEAADIERLIGDEFLRAGGIPGARAFVVSLANGAFTLENGELKGTQMSPDRPGQPMSLGEWIALRQVDEASSYAFKRSNGSGADPKKGSGTGHAGRTIRNPTPAELGRHAKEIASGTIKIQYDE
jgi:hypothetical protein